MKIQNKRSGKYYYANGTNRYYYNRVSTVSQGNSVMEIRTENYGQGKKIRELSKDEMVERYNVLQGQWY